MWILYRNWIRTELPKPGKKTSLSLSIGSLSICLGIWLSTGIFEIILKLLLIIYPAVISFLYIKNRKHLIFGEPRAKGKPSIFIPYFITCLAVEFISHDINYLIDSPILIIIGSASVFILITAVIIAWPVINLSNKDGWITLFVYVMLFGFYCDGSTLITNRIFDISQPQKHVVEIVEKKSWRSRGGVVYEMKLTGVESITKQKIFDINKRIYDVNFEKGKINLWISKGFWGIPHYHVTHKEQVDRQAFW